MKTKYFISILILLFLSSSCDDILVEKPKRFIAPSEFFNTEAEAEAAIYGVYDFLNEPRIGEFFWIFLGDFGTDVSKARNIAQYNYQYGLFDDLPANSDYWRAHYQAIGAANLVIARVSTSEELSDDFKKRIVAEAKFLRGFFYHHLNLMFGNVPLWLDELDLKKVEQLPNVTSAEVKTQIIKDLVDAANDLPSTVSQAGRVTSWAAKGLLARVYLFDNQYLKARNTAKDVIDNSPYSLVQDVKVLFDWKNKNNSELIHVVPKVTEIERSKIHSMCSPRPFDDNKFFTIPDGEYAIRPDGFLTRDKKTRNPGSLFQGWGIYQCMEEYYNSFAQGDTRRELWWHELKFTDGTSYFFKGGGSTALPGHSGYYNLKWIAWDEAPANGGRDTHLQRLAELYLIYAEAENELNGPTANAYTAINKVRRRAFGDTDHDLSGLSKEQFKQAIIDENKWELGGEGLRRWYLWHWGYNTYIKVAKSVASSNPQLGNNLKAHHIYFKIPETEIAKNPNLIQNQGY